MFRGSSVHVRVSWSEAARTTVRVWVVSFLICSTWAGWSVGWGGRGTANLPSWFWRRVSSHGWVQTQSRSVSCLIRSIHATVHSVRHVWTRMTAVNLLLDFAGRWVAVFIVLYSVMRTTRSVWLCLIVVVAAVITIICVGARWSLCWSTSWSTGTSNLACSRSVICGVSHWFVLFSMASVGSTHGSIVGIDHLNRSITERVEHIFRGCTACTAIHLGLFASARAALVFNYQTGCSGACNVAIWATSSCELACRCGSSLGSRARPGWTHAIVQLIAITACILVICHLLLWLQNTFLRASWARQLTIVVTLSWISDIHTVFFFV